MNQASKSQIKIKDMLKEHQLRHTDCREEVLGIFLEKEFALAHSDLERSLENSFDRVTLYRTLKSFLEKGIIHKVLDDEGTPKYALCNEQHCSEHAHQHEHVHFKCQQCGQTQCLDSVQIPALQLPSGFSVQETNLLIQGTCQKCNHA